MCRKQRITARLAALKRRSAPGGCRSSEARTSLIALDTGDGSGDCRIRNDLRDDRTDAGRNSHCRRRLTMAAPRAAGRATAQPQHRRRPHRCDDPRHGHETGRGPPSTNAADPQHGADAGHHAVAQARPRKQRHEQDGLYSRWRGTWIAWIASRPGRCSLWGRAAERFICASAKPEFYRRPIDVDARSGL